MVLFLQKQIVEGIRHSVLVASYNTFANNIVVPIQCSELVDNGATGGDSTLE